MPTSPRSADRTRLSLPAALVALLALAGCGAPPELRQSTSPAGTASPTATASPTPSQPPVTGDPPPAPVPLPTPSDLVASPCPAGPTGNRVISLLRGAAHVLPRDVQARVRTGPLCAGDWQYTVLEVIGHEELQVVTKGRPNALKLVTAGTDVCSVEVRAAGPPGIRTLACTGTPGA